jgi:hypothetical protein
MEILDDEWVKKLLKEEEGVEEPSSESSFNLVMKKDETDGLIIDENVKEESEDSDDETDDDIEKWIEKSYPEYVNITFVYISVDEGVMGIKKIVTEKIELLDGGLLKKELLLYLIQKKKKRNYKLNEILLYQNLIDEIDGNFENKLKRSDFLKIMPFIDNVNFEEQIYLFQSLNTIYVLLNEIDVEESEIVNGRKTFKRVPYKKYTRKVRYFNQLDSKKTRKRVSFDI